MQCIDPDRTSAQKPTDSKPANKTNTDCPIRSISSRATISLRDTVSHSGWHLKQRIRATFCHLHLLGLPVQVHLDCSETSIATCSCCGKHSVLGCGLLTEISPGTTHSGQTRPSVHLANRRISIPPPENRLGYPRLDILAPDQFDLVRLLIESHLTMACPMRVCDAIRAQLRCCLRPAYGALQRFPEPTATSVPVHHWQCLQPSPEPHPVLAHAPD